MTYLVGVAERPHSVLTVCLAGESSALSCEVLFAEVVGSNTCENATSEFETTNFVLVVRPSTVHD